ncbi:MAG: PorP/SprF family type IX secretion system membrane protein [Saprospiraceae bacterium]
MNFYTAKKLRQALVICLALVCFQFAQAQEIHFSQIRNAPLQLNPALAGIFDGDHRFAANYRSQWQSVPVGYQTLNGSWDTRFNKNKSNTNFFGGGIVFNYDWAGDSRLSTTYLALNGSYTQRIAKQHFIGGGISIGGFQRAFKMDDLRWDDQFIENGKQYNPDALTGENFDNTGRIYGDFSAGLNYHFRKEEKKRQGSRTTLDVGAGLLHINRPEQNFYENETVRLERLLNIYGLTTLQLSKKFDLVALFNGRYQGEETEHVANLGGRLHLNPKPTHRTAVGLGVGYRWNAEGFGTGDAIIPNIEVLFRDWLFGFSYDINISDFGRAANTNATNNFGGPEFSVIYMLRRVNEREFCPTCPVYQ